MPTLKEGESIWYGEIIRDAVPGPDDISQDVAMDLARKTIMEESQLTKEALEAAAVLVDFYERDSGNPMWGFSFQLTDNGIEQDWGLMVDARTGEILLLNVITGGNG